MSRLIDRIIAQKVFNPAKQSYEVASITTALKGGDAIITVIDNVAEFLSSQDGEQWDLNDYPNLMPPFPIMWMEWEVPHKEKSRRIGAVGALFCTYDLQKDQQRGVWEDLDYYLEEKKQARWLVTCLVYREDKYRIIGPSLFLAYALTYEGRLEERENEAGWGVTKFYPDEFSGIEGNEQESGHRRHAYIDFTLPSFLLAISFFHCKNIQCVPITPSRTLSLFHSQKHHRPLLCYHVLEIDPMKKTLREEGQSEILGLKKSLHICRGHFADYTEGKGLFGKLHGLFWIPQHVRGSASEGIVVKDYAVKAPKEGTT